MANRNAFYYVLDRDTGEFLRRALREADLGEGTRRRGRPMLLPAWIRARRHAGLSQPARRDELVQPVVQSRAKLFYVSVREMGAYYFKGEAEYVAGRAFMAGGEQALGGDEAYGADSRARCRHRQAEVGVPPPIAALGRRPLDRRRPGLRRDERGQLLRARCPHRGSARTFQAGGAGTRTRSRSRSTGSSMSRSPRDLRSLSLVCRRTEAMAGGVPGLLAGRSRGQLDRDAKPRLCIPGVDPAAVQLDGPAGDRQSKADTAAGAAPVAADAIKGLEDRLQAILRNARTMIPDRDRDGGGTRRSSTATAVPSGAWRTALRSTFSTARRSSSRSPRTIAGPSAVTLKRHPPRLRANGPRPGREPGPGARGFRARGTRGRPRPAQLQELFDEHGEAADLARDPLEGGLGVLARAGQLDGEGEPRQGRTQLVRDVLEQSPLDGKSMGSFEAHECLPSY